MATFEFSYPTAIDFSDPESPVFTQAGEDLPEIFDEIEIDIPFVVESAGDTLSVGDTVTVTIQGSDTVPYMPLGEGGPTFDVAVSALGGGTATYLGQYPDGAMVLQFDAPGFSADLAASNPVLGSVDETVEFDGTAVLIPDDIDDDAYGEGEPAEDWLEIDYGTYEPEPPDMTGETYTFTNFWPDDGSFDGGDPDFVAQFIGADSPFEDFTANFDVTVYSNKDPDEVLNEYDEVAVTISGELVSPDGLTILRFEEKTIPLGYLGAAEDGSLLLSDGDYVPSIEVQQLSVDPGTGATTVEDSFEYEFDGYLLFTNAELSDGDVIPINYDPFVVCFDAGTLIATPSGEVTVESLKIGDMVLTADGGAVPVKWLGRQTIHHRFGPAERLAPVVIEAGALAPNVPHSDLGVTTDHGMLIDGCIVHAGALVNGDTIRRVPLSELPPTRMVYHVETGGHEAILANGAAAETFVDNVTRRGFDNFAEYKALYGEASDVVPMPLPRATGPRQVPVSIRARLASRMRSQFSRVG